MKTDIIKTLTILGAICLTVFITIKLGSLFKSFIFGTGATFITVSDIFTCYFVAFIIGAFLSYFLIAMTNQKW